MGNDIWLEFEQIQKGLDFVRTSKNPMDERLTTAALFLALIKTMHQHQFDFEIIRHTSLTIATALVKPENKFHFLFKRLTTKIVTTSLVQTLLKYKIEKTRKLSEPEGFVVEYVPAHDKEFLFGLDIVECGICKLFKKHESEEYTKILCEVDYITSEIAGLKLLRTGTIANGSSKCDFRFARKN